MDSPEGGGPGSHHSKQASPSFSKGNSGSGSASGCRRHKPRASITGNTDVPGEFEQTQVRTKLSGDLCRTVRADSDHALMSLRASSLAVTCRKSATRDSGACLPRPAPIYLVIAILGTV